MTTLSICHLAKCDIERESVFNEPCGAAVGRKALLRGLPGQFMQNAIDASRQAAKIVLSRREVKMTTRASF
jgi:hypothetical protein